MDLERYYELRTILQQWKRRLADSLRGRIVEGAHHLERLRQIYAGEGTDEAFTGWLDRWCRQAAIQFILRMLFLRVLEDRDLLGATRIRTTDGQRMWAQLTRNLGAAGYVQWCCWDAAHLLPDLFGPTEYDRVLPDDDLVQRFLDDVWRRPDPNREGRLRFDFRPDPARGDQGFETRFIGDLYQELDAEIRERYALLQTPHFISQFILEHTLLKRFEEKDFREVTLLDPTGGSGHFYVDAFWMFVERYERASGKDREALTSAERAEIARTIIEKHLFGCDINPYATALARFRLTLAACDYAQPTSLRDFRDLHFNLVTIDSLIPYEKLMVGNWQTEGKLAQVFGQPEAIERALPVLRKRYEVVVGNPPYIVARDKIKKGLYVQHYRRSASGKFHLGAPFTERFFQFASADGRVGLINSNAFMKRDFGRTVIEKFLPTVNLESIVDLSAVDIPHHGTPTLILLGSNRPPQRDTVAVVSCIQGGSPASSDSHDFGVWDSIIQNFPNAPYEDKNIKITKRARQQFVEHPWDFRFEKVDLIDRLSKTSAELADLAIPDGVGVSLFTLLDEIFVQPADTFRRLAINQAYTCPIVLGEEVRAWEISAGLYVLFPYVLDQEQPVAVKAWEIPELWRFLAPFRGLLSSSHTAGHKAEQTGWYEYGRLTTDKYQGNRRLAFAAIATHNHFVVDTSSKFRLLFKQSAPLVKLEDDSHGSNCTVAALLNSPIACLYLKQKCYNKGAGHDPVRDRYDLSGTSVASIPIPKQHRDERLAVLSEEIVGLAHKLALLGMPKIFELKSEAYHSWNSALDGYAAAHPDLPPPFTTARELRAARDKLVALRQDIRVRMIFLQEEMDWLAYEMYGLLKGKAPLAEDYLSRADYEAARLELGQRPFEVAGKGYRGDWPQGYEPAPLPESLRPLTEARLAVMAANEDIALLEDPLYKRRWVPPDYDREFRDAAAWWLAEKLEWALEQHGRPLSLRGWARPLGQDERVAAVLEVLTGTQLYDLDEELLKVIRANAVPNRPEGYLKPEGLRKFYAARASDPPGTPEYKSSEFGDGTAWKLRGKLNIPRERFIHYAEFDHTPRGVDAPDSGGPWFGWAGWDAARRADALAFLLDQANRAGWELHWRQCGLRAALRDLLPELKDLPAADRAEFEAIAGMCGIGLGTGCYCQAYRDGVARGEPGVPGVGAEVLGVKVVAAEGKHPPKGRRKAKPEAEQMKLDLIP